MKVVLFIVTGAAIGLGLIGAAFYHLSEAAKPGRHYE